MKKSFFKRSVGLFLVVSLIVTVFIVGATASDTNVLVADDSDRVPDVFKLQAMAVDAYSVLQTTFTVDKYGVVFYPADYAGAWIDDFKLHIAVVATKQKPSVDYVSLLKEFDCVVYEVADYSLNELDSVRNYVFRILKKEYPIVSHYVDVKTNKIYLGLLESNEKNNEEGIVSSISLLLESNGLKDILPDRGITDDLFVLYYEDGLINTEATIYGGMAMNIGSSTGLCTTIGVAGKFTANSVTYNGIITHGHELAVSGTNQTIYRGGSEFGKVALLMYQNNGSGDWACVRMTSSDTLTNQIYGSSSAYVRNITGTLDDLAVGTAVMKYGRASGYAEAVILAQGVDVTTPEGYLVKGLTKANLTSGASTGGDSGGPYYTQSSSGGNSYNFVGVHHGSNTGNGGTNVWFTPYVRFKSYFTVKTS